MNAATNHIQKHTCTSIKPNGKDICISRNECEKQADICLEKTNTVIIWGYILDSDGMPVEDAMVRLLKYKNKICLEGICHTFTDCDGFYQFNLTNDSHGKYHIVANKSNYEHEHRHCSNDIFNTLSDENECDCCYCKKSRENTCNCKSATINKVKYCY